MLLAENDLSLTFFGIVSIQFGIRNVTTTHEPSITTTTSISGARTTTITAEAPRITTTTAALQ